MGIDKHQELRDRTKNFALRIIRLSRALPNSREPNVISGQMLRSATGMAANYRAVGRARSKAEFIAKLGVVVEEADETVFWLELLSQSGIIEPAKLTDLIRTGKINRLDKKKLINCLPSFRPPDERLNPEFFQDVLRSPDHWITRSPDSSFIPSSRPG